MVKRNVIFLSVLVLTTMLVGIGVSYSLWNISVSQDTTNIAETKCFDLSISNQENSINLDNAYPISNDNGKSLIPYTFTITNTCDITTEYSVNLEVLKDSTLSSKFIDVMFEGNINSLSSYDSTDKVNTSSIESRKLTTGILKSQESKDYSLKLWIDYNTTLEDLNNEIKSFKSKIVVVGKLINYTGETVFNFDYTGSEQTFTAPVSGTYKLETWGSQGGSGVNKNTQTGGNDYYIRNGGYGGYSTGYINLTRKEKVYLNIGGGGTTLIDVNKDWSNFVSGGYNGGGSGIYHANGGGATNISSTSGILSSLENSKVEVLIVAGGGGGASAHVAGGGYCLGGSGGGFKANNGIIGSDSYGGHAGIGGTQQSGYKFGQGENGISDSPTDGKSGGGGGWYGGGMGSGETSWTVCAGGGSGYIGNSLLTNKVMYCYNCEESNEESTKTISTTCNEEIPTSYCAKKGNGYARITLVNIDE